LTRAFSRGIEAAFADITDVIDDAIAIFIEVISADLFARLDFAIALLRPRAALATLCTPSTHPNILGASGAVVARLHKRLVAAALVVDLPVAIVVFAIAHLRLRRHLLKAIG
jgi:hypothetical protein